MKKTLIALLLLTLAAPLAQGEGPVDETRFTLREELLRLINRDRKQFGLAPVELDPFASAVADNYCKQQIKDRVSGHFGLDGLAPYMRYSFAGGNDGISENAAAWSASYSFSARALYDMLRRSETAMMNEVPPYDGHRRTILDRHATHVGIGVAWEHGEFRIAEEFVRRYVTWSKSLPRTATTADQVLCSGKPVDGYAIDAVSVHYEQEPLPISAVVANRIDQYSLPEKRHDYLPRLASYRRMVGTGIEDVTQFYRDGRRGDFPVAKDGSFAFHIPFTDGPGVYTVVVWVHKKGESEPIPSTNVSIRVEDVAQVSYSTR